jgi:hypothetical protein
VLSCIIVGGGPGGLGPLIWAAQNGRLESWLDQGVALLERSDRLGGSLGRYGICSDSLGGSYLECLDPPALPEPLARLRDDPVTEEMRAWRNDFPPLPLVDRYMARVGNAVGETIGRHPASAVHLGTTARSIHRRADGSVAVFAQGPDGRLHTLVARSAVVAIGGCQPWCNKSLVPGLSIADCRAPLLASNELLTHAGLSLANDILQRVAGRRIVILGGSHSAYAAVQALLHLPAAAGLGPGQITILQRRPPRVFYPDRTTADADAYPVDSGDLCPRTQRVNRMGGVRGHGRDIWRRITGRPGTQPETRVSVLSLAVLSPAQIRRMIDEAALVAPCLGYRSATLPIVGPSGERLALRADADGDAVDDDCRLVLADGSSLPNVYGIGLGSGFRPSLAMGCEPNFRGQANSLWLYQNDIGGTIWRGIHGGRAALAA